MTEPLISTQTANEQLRRADERWAAAVRGLQPYAERLRELADAAHRSSARRNCSLAVCVEISGSVTEPP